MTTPETSPAVRPREIAAWAMFDFANSSYTTVIVTVAYAVFFTKLVAAGPRADHLWGTAIMVSNLIVVVLSPLIGAIADESGRKKLFLFGTYALCVGGTAALGFVGPGDVVLGLVFFVVSNVAFSFGENLCAAFLPELSTPENVGRISGFGWGLGYLGGLGALLAVRPLIAKGFTLENLGNLKLAWVVTALFFLVAALPTFFFLRERAPRHDLPLATFARRGFGRLLETARAIRQFRQLAYFLAVFFVFSAGLMSVIAFVGVYAERTVGFSPDDLIVLFLLVQISSAAGAVGFGFIQDKVGARRTIQATLLVWIAVCALVYFTSSKSVFWGIALFAGLGIGSLQSASRGLVGLFSPVEKSGEFFAFWGLAGKGAYALGPAIFGLISSASGSQKVAILSTAAFFLAGFVGMLFVDERGGLAAAAAWHREHRASGPMAGA